MPESLIRAFDERFGVPDRAGLGDDGDEPARRQLARCRPTRTRCPRTRRYALRAWQGRIQPLVDFRIDEEAGGELQVRGPFIARDYYDDPTSREKFTEDGWLRTGDVAELRHGSYIHLVDRTKDLVKSGGEWISLGRARERDHGPPRRARGGGHRRARREVERAAVRVRGHAATARRSTPTAMRGFLEGRVAKWWLPDRVEFIDEVPKTSVGKFDKKALRARFAEPA